MNDLRCLIVDDEPLAIDVVANYLERLEIRAITRCENGMDAFRQLQQQAFDLVFLDIQMPRLSGFDLLKSLSQRPMVVITTAFRDYAVEGFDWEVLDYLVKPFSFARFMQTMEKVRRTEKDFVFLKADRQWIRVDMSEILYIESLKDYVRVVTTTGEYVCHQPLTEITDKLPPERFLRVHRSYTIAIGKVHVVKHHCAHIGGKAIPISRANRQEVYRRLEQR